MRLYNAPTITHKSDTPQYYDQIVIGAGSSALAFLHSAYQAKLQGHNPQSINFIHGSTLVLGGPDLWKPYDANHVLGQPPALMTQSTPKNLPTKQPKDSPYKQQFITAGGIVQQNEALRQTIVKERGDSGRSIEFRALGVSKITRGGSGYLVRTTDGKAFTGKQVIIATGVGPPKDMLSSLVTNPQMAGGRSYTEMIDAVSYMQDKDGEAPRGSSHRVLVYGGSATASWAVEHALSRGNEVIWMCRKGIEQISTEGNPVGRNSHVILEMNRRKGIYKGEIKAITFGQRNSPKRILVSYESEEVNFVKVKPQEMKITQKVKNPMTGKEEVLEFPGLRGYQKVTGKKNWTLCVDQIVFALGSDPKAKGGAGEFLDNGIQKDLAPVKWNQSGGGMKYLANDSVLALKTPDGSLWVVGASVYGALGLSSLSTRSYADLGLTMPGGTRPPEGIPILTYAIGILTGDMPNDDGKTPIEKGVNLDKAPPGALYEAIEKRFHIPKASKQDIETIFRDMVDSIVQTRADCKVSLASDVVMSQGKFQMVDRMALILQYYKEQYGVVPKE